MAKLLEMKEMNDHELQQLMEIYIEGNRENVAYFYPDCTDIAEGIKKVAQNFCKFIRRDFFSDPENSYYVLEENGVWVSALRLNRLPDFYYIEALETAPEYRRQGFASRLLSMMLENLREKGEFIVRDTVRKTNLPSLATHKKCGFEIEFENAADFLYGGEPDPKSYTMIYRHA